MAAACIGASLCITQGPARCSVSEHSRCSTACGAARTFAQRCSRERALLSAAACFWSRLLGEPLVGAGSACTAGAASHAWDRAGGTADGSAAHDRRGASFAAISKTQAGLHPTPKRIHQEHRQNEAARGALVH